MQLLYAAQINPDDNYLKLSRKDSKEKSLVGQSLMAGFELYFWLLSLIIELHDFAEQRIEQRMSKRMATDEDRNPNKRFINNRLSQQMCKNKQLLYYIKKFRISWKDERAIIKSLYTQVVKSEEYKLYMENEEDSYDVDRLMWRHIYKRMIALNEELGDCLEEINLFWNDDAEIIMSFIDKTLKRYSEDYDEDHPLLPMYNSDDDEDFAYELYQYALENRDEYMRIIEETVKNWKIERMTYMDLSIMQAALAELTHFPTIPVAVTLNEYIEISKYYSTDKSYEIVNGVLDAIVKRLASENRLIKPPAETKEPAKAEAAEKKEADENPS